MRTPGPRRQAREIALQVLYAADAAERLDVDSVEALFREISEQFQIASRARQWAHALAVGVVGNLKQIDERVAGASERWKLHRLARVDRNVLRVATYELLFEPETPTEVILDEAVEVARRFAGEASPAFVNGVLDLIARDRAAGDV